MSTGSIAPNFHEGTRSEYLAQYIFSAFGTSTPVPHPEDSGIDLHCTLGKRIGQRLHVQNYFFVQIKSNKEEVLYEGKDSVEWLLSHKYPFFICIIDKKYSFVEIYQTLSLTLCLLEKDLVSITLNFKELPEVFGVEKTNNSAALSLGPPILRFQIKELEDPEWTENAKAILKLWVEMDQENIDLKAIGLNCFQYLTKYLTNERFEEFRTFKANFKFEENHQYRFNDIFLRMLSMIVHQVASEKNPQKFNLLLNSIKNFTAVISLNDSWGTKLLANAVNTGAKHLGINGNILLRHPDGRAEHLVSDILT